MGDTLIPQAFVIQGIDLDFGDVHDCYLALRLDTLKYVNQSITYIADLVIVNTVSNKIKTENLEDMVAPIPPFKPQYPKEDFGLLKTLDLD